MVPHADHIFGCSIKPTKSLVEGIFKGLEKINEYISLKRDMSDSKVESESAYW
jgi:hypothetical protein